MTRATLIIVSGTYVFRMIQYALTPLFLTDNKDSGESTWEAPPGFVSKKAAGGGSAAAGSSSGAGAGAGSMTYDQVMQKRGLGAKSGLDISKLEMYLAPGEFPKIFQMSQADFNALPDWKKEMAKRKAKLY